MFTPHELNLLSFIVSDKILEEDEKNNTELINLFNKIELVAHGMKGGK